MIMLTGIAGAAVPLVLHLLARARYRSIDWGAMMFLYGTDHKQQQGTKLKQWILLAMRMLLVTLIATAMARPILTGNLRSFALGGHVDAVVILDCSGSSAVEENGQARLESVRRAAISVISQLQRGDQVSLILAGTPRPPTRLSTDLQQVAQDAATAGNSDGVANIAAALNDAAGVLQASQGSNREVYIIADKQSENWKQIDASFAAGWRKRWEDTSVPPRLYFIPIGGVERSNIAIASFTARGLPAVVRQPIELEVTLRNNGSEVTGDVPVSITQLDKQLYASRVTLPPNSTTTLRAVVQFDSPGSQVLRAQSASRIMPLAARRDLSILVTPPLPVLIISGDEREGAFRKESDFLRLALAPWATSGEKGPDPAAVTVITPAKWTRLELAKWPVVVLANVSSLSEAQARDLEQFVYSGGGLLVTAGNMVQSDNFNSTLFREGSGILPAKLADSMSSKATSAMALIGVDINHPAMRFLQGRPDPVPSISVSRHIPIEWMTSDARQLMTLSSGEPLLLERRVGRGAVMLFTSSIDPDWNTLPLSGAYLPMMQSMVRYLASSQLPESNLRPGEPVVLSVDDIAEETRPRITRPDGSQEEMEMRASTLGAELRYAKTLQTGQYTLKLKSSQGEKLWTFVVAPPAEESNLTPYTEKQISQCRNDLGFTILEPQADQIAAAVGKQRKGREFWLPLLLAAIALSAVELWFSRRCTAS